MNGLTAGMKNIAASPCSGFSSSIRKLALKIRRNISSALRYTKEKMVRLHTRKVSTLTKEEIEDVFWKLSPSSFNAHIRRVRSVLAYGVKHGYLSTNPALLVQQIKRPRQSVKVLPVETVELMLRTAQASVPEVLPFFCVLAILDKQNGRRPRRR